MSPAEVSRTGLAVEPTGGPVVVVIVLPLFEFRVEDAHVVDDRTVEQPIELLGICAVRAFRLSVQPQGAGLDVDVVDALVEHVPVESGLEIRPVVGLHCLDRERQLREHVVEEFDRGLLVVARIDFQNPQSGAVVDHGELMNFPRRPTGFGVAMLLVLSGRASTNLTSIWTWWPGR